MLITKKLFISFCDKYTFDVQKHGYLLILMSKLINYSQNCSTMCIIPNIINSTVYKV